jgi:hypothetical protein
VCSDIFTRYKVEILGVLVSQCCHGSGRSKEHVPHFPKDPVERKLIFGLDQVVENGSMVMILMAKGHDPFR